MISNIYLNPATGLKDIVNIIIVYSINALNGSYWCRNGLFGYDIRSFDKFVAFSPVGELLVSATVNDCISNTNNAFNSKKWLIIFLMLMLVN